MVTAQARRRDTLTFGTGIFLVSEVTFFIGLISAYVVLRSQFSAWPPMGQPRLPVEVTALNTAILIGSGALAWSWWGVLDKPERLTRRVRATFGMGAIFVAIQGFEWSQLIAHGMSTTRDVYGGLFIAIVGAHALHVLGAMVVLSIVATHAAAGAYDKNVDGVRAARLYWLFVVAVWPILYLVVYLW